MHVVVSQTPNPRPRKRRAERERRDAARAAASFEQQLAELEAAAAAAEAVSQSGLSGLQAQQQQQWQQQQQQQALQFDADMSDDLDLGLAPELLELIGSFESTQVDDIGSSSASHSSTSVPNIASNGGSNGRAHANGSSGGAQMAAGEAWLSGTGAGGGGCGMDAAEAALMREMERLEQLQVGAGQRADVLCPHVCYVCDWQTQRYSERAGPSQCCWIDQPPAQPHGWCLRRGRPLVIVCITVALAPLPGCTDEHGKEQQQRERRDRRPQ